MKTMTLHEVLDQLYSAAKDNLGADGLRAVGDTLADIAECHANDMRDVMDGISCLVACDEPAGAGSFRDSGSMFTLLGMAARQFDLLAGMVVVAKEATWKAEQIEKQAGKGGDHE